MNLPYRLFRLAGRFVFAQTIRVRSINTAVLDRAGGYVLATSHLGNLEPVCASILAKREIRWVTRKEFYARRLLAAVLRSLGTIKINRQGRSVSAIRQAIAHARRGQVVGIFPEGGVARGRDSVLRGGRIKRGACSIAIRSGVPIVPCVIIGAERLNRVQPWLPFKRGELVMACGDPIHPPTERCTREQRRRLAEQTRHAMMELYERLQREHGVCDNNVP